MKLKKIKLNFFTILKYAFVVLSFFLFNNLEKDVYPYSISIFIAYLYGGCDPLVTLFLFLSPFLLVNKLGYFFISLIPGVFFTVIFLITNKLKKKLKLELVAVCLLTLIPFLIFGDFYGYIKVERRIIVTLLILFLTFLSILFCDIFKQKGLKIKLENAEYPISATLIILFALGVCNLFSPLVWKAIFIFVILFTTYIYKGGNALVTCATFSIPFVIFYTNLNFFSVSIILCLCAMAFMKISRRLSTVILTLADLVLQFIFNVYPSSGIDFVIPTIISVIVFSFIPERVLVNLKNTLYTYREKQLVRKSINQNRNIISNRIFELSSVFNEMSNAITAFQKNNLDENTCKNLIAKEISKKVCASCERYSQCKSNKTPSSSDLSKLIDIGFAKGKVSVIDMPLNIENICIKQSNMIFVVNKMLAEHRKCMMENQNYNQARTLVADLSDGVSSVLKKVALDTSTQLKYQSKLEEQLLINLKKNGFSVSELLIFGENDNLNVSLILTMKEYSLTLLERTVSSTLNQPFSLFDRADVTDDKCFLSFKKSPKFDAVFGVATCIKDGSEFSGDTHSVNKLFCDKFLVALSDGMGSGEYAKKVSSISLALIESLYKSGIDSAVILQTVNKLLAINTEDTFTALDIAVINLKNATVDFIKYGSPYGFIIGDEGIKIVEGNTLPLGILSELKPSVCTAQLSDGDVVLFVTDGVSDAFKSTNEIIEFLKGVPAKNPQALADRVIEKALIFSNGKRNDDMTALAVRVFKKTC